MSTTSSFSPTGALGFKSLLSFLAFFTILSNPFYAHAQDVDWPTLGFEQVGTNTFYQPTAIAHANDGTDRIFVVEQTGRVWVIQGDTVASTPFLDITNRVYSQVEAGCLGLAFSPGFSNNHFFYLSYSRLPDYATVVSRFRAVGNIADPNSEQVLLVVPHASRNHFGGCIAFGPDGFLYISRGDADPGGDQRNWAQDPSMLNGKILRIDPESGVLPYSIPPGNPFVGRTNYAPEIWALGLRNPWKFSFDRATGGLYIGDVGEETYEEIDFQPAGSPGGQNYGWRIQEGPANYAVPDGFTNFAALTPPVTSYLGGAVIGGHVYRGPNEPRMNGIYFFGDWSSGGLWGLKQVSNTWRQLSFLAHGGHTFTFSTFGEDDAGHVLFADYLNGKIYKISDTHHVVTPRFSVSGTSITTNSVMVFCDTLDADMHYTTDLRDPDATDPLLASGQVIPVSSGTTYKLRAFRPDLQPSAVASATYTFKVGTPVFTPATGLIKSNTLITMTCETPGAAIYYNTNGATPSTNSALYTGPVSLARFTTLRAFAVKNGYADSSVAFGNYNIAQASTPVLAPPSGFITNGSLITITCATPDAVIYYTVDGSEPTKSSQIYSGPFSINPGATVKAFAAATNYLNSSVRTLTYVLSKTGTPTFSPPGGPVTNGTTLLLSAAEYGSVIRYTVDGSPVTTNSQVYASPIVISNQVTITAQAFRPDLDTGDARVVYYGMLESESTVVTTVAGGNGTGLTNGFGAAARFFGPRGVAIGPSGILYVSDTLNKVVRRISPAGEVDTYAGTGADGSQDGVRTNAQFSQPIGIYAHPSGQVFVVDNCSKVRLLSTNGLVSTFATWVNSCGWQLTGDSLGNLYVGSELGVRQISPAGVVTALTGQGLCCANGWGVLVGPAVGPNDSLFVASGANLIFEVVGGNAFTNAGSLSGYSDGSRETCRFEGAWGLAVDSRTNLFVSDRRGIRKIYPDGRVTTFAGGGVSGYKDGRGSEARFGEIDGICVDTNGNVYVADFSNNCIRKISVDTGGMAIADEWRQRYFGTTSIDPNADPDNDGMSNYAEFWAGTNPLDSNSVLLISSVTVVTGNAARVTWKSTPGKNYVLKYSNDHGPWIQLGPPVQGNGTELSIIDQWPVNLGKQRFYRVFLSF